MRAAHGTPECIFTARRDAAVVARRQKRVLNKNFSVSTFSLRRTSRRCRQAECNKIVNPHRRVTKSRLGSLELYPSCEARDRIIVRIGARRYYYTLLRTIDVRKTIGKARRGGRVVRQVIRSARRENFIIISLLIYIIYF